MVLGIEDWEPKTYDLPLAENLELSEQNQILRWIYYHIFLLHQANFLAFNVYKEIIVCMTIFTIYLN